MDRSTFLRELQRSKLLSELAIKEAVAQLPESDEARTIARKLVARGLLSKFQARQLLAGKGGRLTLGSYRLLAFLGRGGAGRVFKAVHTTMDRIVALKIIRSRVLKDSGDLNLFKREVRTAAQLHHPNIVTAYDAAQEKGLYFLVMEYIEGPSLHELVKQQGPLPVSLGCELMRQAAIALQHAHEKGVVHRDIKPANLLILRPAASWAEGQANEPPGLLSAGPPPLLKVVDFGLARLQRPVSPGGVDTIPADTGTVLGTLDYISPEQANNIHDADIRSDLYSLGCTFYYALSGRVPFPADFPMAKLLHHLMEDAEPLENLCPEVPPGVAAIIRRLMAKNREHRFQTPAELSLALAPWCRPTGERIIPAAADPEPALEAPRNGLESGTVFLLPEEAETAQGAVEPRCSSVEPALTDTAFRDKWEQWTAVVEVSLRRRGSRRWINAKAFESFQQELVKACQERVRKTEGRARAFFESLAELVEPWLAPQTLLQTDLEVHYSILLRCQQALRELDRWCGERHGVGREGDTVLGRFLNHFKPRQDRLDFKEKMRELFGAGW